MGEPRPLARKLIDDHLVAGDRDRISAGDTLVLDGLRDALPGGELTVRNTTRDEAYRVTHRLTERQVEAVLAGGRIPWPAARQ
ncbi:hypothetical protein GCM10027258_91970 [Amycolatopsis stemonae]